MHLIEKLNYISLDLVSILLIIDLRVLRFRVPQDITLNFEWLLLCITISARRLYYIGKKNLREEGKKNIISNLLVK